MAGSHRRWRLLDLCLALACLNEAVMAQGSGADDLNVDITDGALLQGPPDPFDGGSTNEDIDGASAVAAPSKKSNPLSSYGLTPVDKLSADVDAISDNRQDKAMQNDVTVSVEDLEMEGRRAATAATSEPSPAAQERRARIEQHEINSRHTFVADAGAFNVAKDEISRAKAENAAALVERAVASKRKAEKQAAYLLAVAEGYRKQEAQAMKNVEVVATEAARRAAAQFRTDHMRNAKLLEAKSWKASQLASQTRAAADADVQKAFAGLGKVQAF